MARLARIVIPHVPHHITQRESRRLPVSFSDADREVYLALPADYSQASRNVGRNPVPANLDGATLWSSARSHIADTRVDGLGHERAYCLKFSQLAAMSPNFQASALTTPAMPT